MPVDVADHRRLVNEQAAERVQPEPQMPDFPKVDITEYLTENEAVNNVVRRMGLYLGQLQYVLDDCKDKMPAALNEPATRGLQTRFWQHWGKAEGIKEVLVELKKQSRQ